jgi:hypothetical protein
MGKKRRCSKKITLPKFKDKITKLIALILTNGRFHPSELDKFYID